MCYDKTDYRIIRYPEKKKWKYQRCDGRIYMRRRDREVTELNEIMINLYFMCTVLWKAVSLTLSETIQTAVFRLSVMFSHFQVKWPANMGVVIILLMDLELRRLWKHHKKKLRP